MYQSCHFEVKCKPYKLATCYLCNQSVMLYFALGEKDGRVKDTGPVKREDQLAHLNVDMPASPQPSASSVPDKPGAVSRENSMLTSANLAPDTQKFLKFAGQWMLAMIAVKREIIMT